MASQIVADSKEHFRAGDGDEEEEEDGEETLDPRVKVNYNLTIARVQLPCKFSVLMHYSFFSSAS